MGQNRLHGSLAGLSPKTFWQQWELGNIKRIGIARQNRGTCGGMIPCLNSAKIEIGRNGERKGVKKQDKQH